MLQAQDCRYLAPGHAAGGSFIWGQGFNHRSGGSCHILDELENRILGCWTDLVVDFAHLLLGFITHLGLSHHPEWLTLRAGPKRKFIISNIFVN